MKKLISMPLLFLSLMLGVLQSVQADDIGVAICKSVMSDDKKSLRQALRIGGFTLRDLYKDMRCNNMTLLQVAMSKSSNEVGTFIVSQVSKRVLTGADDVSWAEANGHADSPILAALKERIQ